jgi:site-specific DNA-methyltransferase (adenine-specific)
MNTEIPYVNRIYTGDACALLARWPARLADVVATDPPYGNATVYGRARRRIIGDENPLTGLQGVAACYRVMKRDATAYVFCSVRHLGFLQHFIGAYTKFRLREVLAWDKRQVGFGATFRGAYECILVLEKGQPTYREKTIPTLLSVPRANTSLHPHAKPVRLLERLIAASSDEGGLVLDPFAGSGSTGVAAANLGRAFIGIEIAPHYAGIARSRLERALAERAEGPTEREAA